MKKRNLLSTYFADYDYFSINMFNKDKIDSNYFTYFKHTANFSLVLMHSL